MWDKGWTKVYEVYPEGKLTEGYQAAVGQRLAAIIGCLHPIFVDLRSDVARVYRSNGNAVMARGENAGRA